MGLWFHCLQMLAAGVVVVGPVPLSFAAARLEQSSPGKAADPLLLLTVWTAVQAAVGTALGAAGWLFLPPLLAAEGALFVIGFGVLKRLSPRPASEPKASAPIATTLARCGLASLTALFAWIAATSLAADVDSLAYHLPTIGHWHATGALGVLEQFELLVGRYPFCWEVVASCLVLPFSSDFLVTVPNIVALLVLVLAIADLAELAGCPRDCSIAAAIAIAVTPVVTAQLDTMHVDLPFAAFFLAGLGWAIKFGRRASPASLVGLLLAIGLCFAVKASAVVYGVVILAALLLARALLRDPDDTRPGINTAAAATAGGAAVLTGGFWYLRNWVQCGSPLGNLRVELFGFELFPGVVDPAVFFETTLVASFDLGNAAHWEVLARSAGSWLGWPAALVAVGAAAALVTGAAADRRWLLLGAVFVVCAAIYVVTPFSARNSNIAPGIHPWLGQQFRFALPALGLLGALGARGIAALGPRPVSAMAVLITGWAAHRVELLLPWLVAIGICAAFLVARRHDPIAGWLRRRCARRFFVAVLAIAIAVALTTARERRTDHRTRAFGRLDAALEEHADGKRLGYLLCERSYPLHGPRLDRDPVWVQRENDAFRQWSERLRGERTHDESVEPDLEAWLEQLRAREIEVVAVGPVPKKWRHLDELEWLADPDGHFRHLYGRNPHRRTVLYAFQTEPDPD